MTGVKTITACRICYGPLMAMCDLGRTPLADSFVTTGKKEQAFPLRVSVCVHCKLVQMVDEVDRDLLFNNDYGFFTGASPSSLQYFKTYAESVMEEYSTDGLVVEIASNDGTLLKHFVKAGRLVLGIDPAGNTVEKAQKNGVRSITAHFSKAKAEYLLLDHEKASVIMANNVLAHIDDIHDFMQGVTLMLSDTGVFIAEVQYLPHLLFNNAFDHIYHEHRSFFSFSPLQKLFAYHGLKIIDVKRADTQGGSIRVYAVKDIFVKAKEGVLEIINYETRMKLDDLTTYQGFQARIDFTKERLVEILISLKAQGKTIYGFGASAKGNTLLNYCGIGTQYLDCVVDLTPHKIGKMTPGMHIPIKHPEEVVPPDYYLLLVWNYLPGVLARNKDYLQKGGHIVLPIPSPLII